MQSQPMSWPLRANTFDFFRIVKDRTANQQRYELNVQYPAFQVLNVPLRVLVEVNGIEPMTSCLQSRRSPN